MCAAAQGEAAVKRSTTNGTLKAAYVPVESCVFESLCAEMDVYSPFQNKSRSCVVVDQEREVMLLVLADPLSA